MTNAWTIGEYEILEGIGCGSSGEIYLARHRTSKVVSSHNQFKRNQDNTNCCVKIVPKDTLKTEADRRHFDVEVNMLKSLNHPNIVKFIELIEDDNNFYLFQEYCPGNDLLYFINSTHGLDEKVVRTLFIQFASVLEYLQTMKIAHRDLKPENLIVDGKNLNLKVIDFGLSSFNDSDNRLLSTFCGSVHYAAPETLLRQPYDGCVADMWSAGVILYAMIVGQLPWADLNNMSLVVQHIVSGEYNISDNVPRIVANLIKMLMTVDPKQRMRAEQLAAYPWLMKNGSNNLSNFSQSTLVKPNTLSFTNNPKMNPRSSLMSPINNSEFSLKKSPRLSLLSHSSFLFNESFVPRGVISKTDPLNPNSHSTSDSKTSKTSKTSSPSSTSLNSLNTLSSVNPLNSLRFSNTSILMNNHNDSTPKLTTIQNFSNITQNESLNQNFAANSDGLCQMTHLQNQHTHSFSKGEFPSMDSVLGGSSNINNNSGGSPSQIRLTQIMQDGGKTPFALKRYSSAAISNCPQSSLSSLSSSVNNHSALFMQEFKSKRARKDEGNGENDISTRRRYSAINTASHQTRKEAAFERTKPAVQMKLTSIILNEGNNENNF